MANHLQFSGVRITAVSAAGVCATEHLILDDPADEKYRQLIVDLVAVLEKQRSRHTRTLRRLTELRGTTSSKAIGDEIEAIRREIEVLTNHLETLTARRPAD